MSTTTHYEVEITVEGRGLFPFDMLRYDSACPRSELDAFCCSDSQREKRKITLRRFIKPGMDPRAGAARWESCGWPIVDVKEDIERRTPEWLSREAKLQGEEVEVEQMHRIKGRGLVMIVKTVLPIKVKDYVQLVDTEQYWRIVGVEMMNPPLRDGALGLVLTHVDGLPIAPFGKVVFMTPESYYNETGRGEPYDR